MDELALLKGFRIDDASPDGAREHSRQALHDAITRSRTKRWVTFALAFVGAAILAAAAYGIAHRLIVGQRAPKEVREQPARFGHSAELIPVAHPNDPRLDVARVAAVLDSSVGTVDLFGSPNATGLCASTWIEGDRGYQGRLNMASSCGSRSESFFAIGNERFKGHSVVLFSGHAGPKVARVVVHLDGKVVDVPLIGRWFLAEFPTWPNRFEFLSYDRNGRRLEDHAFPPHFGRLFHRPRVRPPHQVTYAREIAPIRARGGEQITLFAARASDGSRCQIVRSDRRPSNRTCSVAIPRPREIAVNGMNFGGAPGGVLLLVGPVGSDVATLELRYEDGRVRSIPLTDGWALSEIARADYRKGRRPEVLVGRDAAGKIIATKGFPWIRAAG
jgi:hypothetical protein